MKKTCLHGVKWEEKCRECEVIYFIDADYVKHDAETFYCDYTEETE